MDKNTADEYAVPGMYYWTDAQGVRWQAGVLSDHQRAVNAEMNRLAEEVERLKERAFRLAERKERIEADERARIRRELWDFAREVGWDEAAFRPYLDRICPQED